MNRRDFPFRFALLFVLFIATAQITRSQELLWTVGLDDNMHPSSCGGLGGPEACFVRETGNSNPLPGWPYTDFSVEQGADDDYYFAGSYYYAIQSNVDMFGVYDPLGVVYDNEQGVERAFVPWDPYLRYHFNLPADMKPTDLLSVTFDVLDLQWDATNPHYGVAVYFNGVLVQKNIVIYPAQFDVDYTTAPFSLESVNAVAGPDYDNIVTLRGTAYENEGGGAWMNIDYVQLNKSPAIPVPVFPWWVGSDDDGWPTGDGGGPNATFVAGNGAVNSLPGSATSTETAGGADNDYYFAGAYNTVIAGNGTYVPVGLVMVNEEAAERGFDGAENELRYHFNLPNSMQSSDWAAVTFDALSLDTSVQDPFYGVAVYVNGVLVQSEVVIRTAQLDQPITTAQFTLGAVNARAGTGFDNVVTLRGISHSAEGGGNSLGIDYVRLKPMPVPPTVPWSVGLNDNEWATNRTGGGVYAIFVQENEVTNPLPGVPNSPAVDGQADNDYYLAGLFYNVIPGNGDYVPVGHVPYSEEAAERAFVDVPETPTANDDLRYHFNLPSGLSPDTQLTFSFDPMNLDTSGYDPRYGAEVYVNGVKLLDEVIIRPENLNRAIFTPPFTPAQVNAQLGVDAHLDFGPDNIVSVKGISYAADGGGMWMGIDYVRLDPVLPPPWPLDCGVDDNAHPGGIGGGPNASFVQENTANVLPGNPTSGEVNGQNDDDYYFAGVYTNVIPSVVQFYDGIEYTPVGTVLVNEYAAERAFSMSDNEQRYHFNLPTSLQPTDKLLVSFDAVSLEESGDDPRYGVEVYFNGVLVLPEVTVRPADFDFNYYTEPFTLADVNAQTGPGYDNIVTLRGICYSDTGGGRWMGIDYVAVDQLPQPVFPLAVGKDDDGWPAGDGGGENASFVQENGIINALPGNPKSPEVNQQADNDYYFAGHYTDAIFGNEFYYGEYTPVGWVPRNEEAAERAFAGANNDLRYHFNLPSTLKPTDEVVITFDPMNLENPADEPTVVIDDPRYGIEVYFNSVQVLPEVIIRPAQLGVAVTTPPFTLASVDAQTGLGPDNIVSLKGVNYYGDGGGNWMGIDYVKIDAPPLKFTEYTVDSGVLTLKWVGTGNLEWAPTIKGEWKAVTPTPTSPYTEPVAPGEKARFYRLKKP